MSSKPRSLKIVSSKVSYTFLLLSVILPLLMLAFTILQALDLRGIGFESIITAWIYHLLWLIPFLILLNIIGNYPVLRIAYGKVFLSSLFKNRKFFLSNILAYAYKETPAKRRTLLLKLRDKRIVKIDERYYQNYWALQQVLIQDVPMDSDLLTNLKQGRHQQISRWLGGIGVAMLLLVLFLFQQMEKLPLGPENFQSMQIRLSEKPGLEWKEKDGIRQPDRLVLKTDQYPGIDFQLKGAALRAVTIDSVMSKVMAGDHLEMLVKKKDYYYGLIRKDHPVVRLRAVRIRALQVKNHVLLPISAYHQQHRAGMKGLIFSNMIVLIGLGIGFAINHAARKTMKQHE